MIYADFQPKLPSKQLLRAVKSVVNLQLEAALASLTKSNMLTAVIIDLAHTDEQNAILMKNGSTNYLGMCKNLPVDFQSPTANF